MDIADTVAPKSDQQNYDDYLPGPKTVTVSEVRVPGGDQPVEIHLAEFPGRPFKPSKSMRRVLVAAWGADSKQYAGRRMELFGDPSVKFGGQAVGGIRIRALSHISKPLSISLTTTRGKRAPFNVTPLPDAPAIVNPIDALGQALTGSRTLAELQAAWGQVTTAGHGANPVLVAAKDARKTELAGADIGEKEPA